MLMPDLVALSDVRVASNLLIGHIHTVACTVNSKYLQGFYCQETASGRVKVSKGAKIRN